MKRRVKTLSRAGRTVARVAIGSVREIRRALTVEGDIRSDVQFQNDVNAILAIVGKLTALGPGGAANGEEDSEEDVKVDSDQDSEDIAIEVTPPPQPTAPAAATSTAPPQPAAASVGAPARARRARRP